MRKTGGVGWPSNQARGIRRRAEVGLVERRLAAVAPVVVGEEDVVAATGVTLV